MLSFMVCMHVFRIVYAVYETPTIGEGDHFSCITSAKSLGLLEGSHNVSSSSRRWPYVLHKLAITVQIIMLSYDISLPNIDAISE